MIGNRKTLLFDMDGVLVDSEPQHYQGWEMVFNRLGFSIPWDIYKGCIGSTLGNMFSFVEENTGHKLNDTDSLLAEYKENLEKILKEEGVRKIPAVKRLLPLFREKGYRMAVASSSPMKEILNTLEGAGITDCFELLFTGESVPRPKPAPDTFLKCAEKLGEKPENCIVIEDSRNGTLAARRAGMYCIGIRNPGSGDQDLSAADVIIKTFDELEDLLL